MTATNIREPKQKRSIEKKKKIIEAGYKLFCEKGYYNTNTAEIAKLAGVSTGIVYNYFENKKAILIEALDYYSTNILSPFYRSLESIRIPIELPDLLDKFIDIFIEEYNLIRTDYKEMMAMSYLDEDVAKHFKDAEESATNKILDILHRYGIRPSNPYEKIHIAYNMIESLCHEVVYHNHKNINHDIMKKQVITVILSMLNS